MPVESFTRPHAARSSLSHPTPLGDTAVDVHHPTRRRLHASLTDKARQMLNPNVAHAPLTDTEKGQLQLLINELQAALAQG